MAVALLFTSARLAQSQPTKHLQDAHRVLSGKMIASRYLLGAQTLGILRDLQAFREAWLRVFSALKQNPRPPTRRYRKPLAVKPSNNLICKTVIWEMFHDN